MGIAFPAGDQTRELAPVWRYHGPSRIEDGEKERPVLPQGPKEWIGRVLTESYRTIVERNPQKLPEFTPWNECDLR